MSFAALEYQNRVYFVQSDANSGLFSSPLVQLIQGIYETWPAQARSLMRKRILTNEALSPLAYCTLKVAAKRASVVDLADTELRSLYTDTPEFIPVPPPTPASLDSARELLASAKAHAVRLDAAEPAFAWLDKNIRPPAPETTPRYALDRPVGCVLVDASGRLLSVGFNRGALNKTLHAEIQMLRALRLDRSLDGGLNRGLGLDTWRDSGPLRLYTTLKPCRMCAAALCTWTETLPPECRLEVIFRDPDPGPNGRATLLDLGSHDQRLFAAKFVDGKITQRRFESKVQSAQSEPTLK